MSKIRELYYEDENGNSDDEENFIVKKDDIIEDHLKSERSFEKFKDSFWKINNIYEKLDNYLSLLKCVLSNGFKFKEVSYVNSFIKKGFNYFQNCIQKSKKDEYKDLQKYWEILDLMKNFNSGEFNEAIIDEEIKLTKSKMENFLQNQNNLKKRKKNRKNKLRLERQKERLLKLLEESEELIKEEKENIETISLD